jgi:O-antigen ligase
MAILLAMTVTSAVYAADRPIRIAVASLKNGLSINEESEVAAVYPGNLLFASPRPLLADAPDILDLDIIEGRDLGLKDSGRLPLWRLGYEIIRQKPLFGVSPGAFITKSVDVSDVSLSEESYQALLNTQAGLHSLYIEMAASNGVLSLLLFVVFIGMFLVGSLWSWFAANHTPESQAVTAIIAFCASLLFMSLFETHIFYVTMTTSVMFWSQMSFIGYLIKMRQVVGTECNQVLNT